MAATFTSHATGRRGQHVFEIFAVDADDKFKMKMWQTRHQMKKMKAQMKTGTELITQTRKTLTTWKPPHVETLSVLQLHLEDYCRRRCEQCIRLDFRGSMHRLQQHQQVRGVNELRPLGFSQIWAGRIRTTGTMFPCTSRRTSREFSGTWDTHQYHKWRNFREAKVSDEATEALKHFACDACNRLKQPLARRQVAIAHAKMFNDVVSMDVNIWKLKERHSRKKNTSTVLNIVDAASGVHTASGNPDQTSHAVEDFRARLRCAGAPQCLREGTHRAQMSKEVFDQAEGRRIFVDPVVAEAHSHGASREPCEISSHD